NDEVELTDEESSDNEDDIAEDIMGFKTYEHYKDDWIYEWNENVPWVYDKPWLDNGIWKEPTPVKHHCKPFNYKTRCSEWPTCSWREDGYCNGGNFPGAYVIGNSLHYQDLEWYEALEDSELKEEALRNRTIMEGLIEEDDDDESHYEQKRRWNEAKMKIFNDVHLVFFPCIKLSEEEETSNHYYLICFNMMTAEIDIIDNIHNDLEDLDLRYGPYAMALINTFIYYLGYIKHPKVDAFFSAIPKILRMTWRTTKNAVDCGLFVMRHIEMYNGSGEWINNMKNEKEGQKSQINFFRPKYLAKILLLPYNTSTEELLKEANEKWKKQQNKSNTVTNMDVKVDKNLMKKFNETLQKAYCS
ncbi:ulp1 protease family, C-terminal catalytic domain-containing protein, partial [Tanacetum coccineum]